MLAATFTIINGTRETLIALVGLTVVLWAGATWRHSGAFSEGRLQQAGHQG